MDNPRQTLLFYVAQDVNDEIRRQTSELIKSLAIKHSWVTSPPKFVDVVSDAEEGGKSTPGATVGGEFEICSAIASKELPKDIDRQQFNEVEEIIGAIRQFSEKNGLSFEFEIDGTYVGAIDAGVINRTLSVGLLEEWRNHVMS